MARLSFSQRMGITPAEPPLQVDSLDADARMAIWNAMYKAFPTLFTNSPISFLDYGVQSLCESLWAHYFKKNLANLHTTTPLREAIQQAILLNTAKWNEIFDLCEYLLCAKTEGAKSFHYTLSEALEANNVGYRVVGNEICPITSETELQAIDTALNLPDRFAGARKHLQTALQLFSDRENPDYRNSIKESISAVESVCMVLINNSSASLGDALKLLEKKGIEIHPCLKIGLSKLYGYTSDEGGIRHAMIEEGSSVSQEDALFMLVSCSAFCHYLQQKGSKAGIV